MTIPPDELIEAVAPGRTSQATAYVETFKKKTAAACPTWDDVAAAYDAGLYSGAMGRRKALYALEAIEPGHALVANALRYAPMMGD